MSPTWLLPAAAAIGAACLVAMVALLASNRGARLDERIDDLKGRADARAAPSPKAVRRMAKAALPRVGSALLPSDEKERTKLQARLVQAGLYHRQAMAVFLGVKMILMTGPALAGLGVGLAGLAPLRPALLVGACLGVFGMVGPSFWLDRRRGRRQASFRRGIPDALDVIVICVEGGLSLVGAIRRVAGDLASVHRELADELEIVQREVQLGQSIGEALRRAGERTDLEELRSLASIVIQSERFGAGLSKALRVHADSLRERRRQRAEEMAQKAGTKVLFPTLLFIFPSIFVVILGPAMIQIGATMAKMGK